MNVPDGRSRPKYIRIKNAILQQIRDGHLTSGNQVHSISRIMEEFKVSKVTAVRALAELESEGVVRREHGRGTFVSPRDPDTTTRRRRTVSVVVPDMSNPFHVEVVGSLERRLRDLDVAIELSCTDYEGGTEQAALARAASEAHVSGIVLISTPVPHEVPAETLPRVPLVAIDACPPSLVDKCVFLSCDNYRGGFDAAQHLAGLGHTRVGCVYNAHGSTDRLEGFRQGLARQSVELPDDQIILTVLGASIGAELVDMVRRKRLTAVFTHNDMLAMQAMQLLRAEGYTVPEGHLARRLRRRARHAIPRSAVDDRRPARRAHRPARGGVYDRGFGVAVGHAESA